MSNYGFDAIIQQSIFCSNNKTAININQNIYFYFNSGTLVHTRFYVKNSVSGCAVLLAGSHKSIIVIQNVELQCVKKDSQT